MSALILAALAALAPTLRYRLMAPAELDAARDRWLLGVLTAGIVWLAWHEALWLAFVGLWFLLHWRAPERLPSLVTWSAIAATWCLLRTLPAEAFGWLRAAWLAWAGYQLVVLARRFAWRADGTPGRPHGTFGSPAATALYLALVAPLAPWWYTPVLAAALALTCSWLAFLALGAACVVLWPWTAPLLAFFALALALGWLVAYPWGALTPVPLRWWRVLAWTPRGDSLGPIIGRLYVWRLVPPALTLAGHGPGSMEPQLRRWSTLYRQTWIPRGDAHMELLQFAYEYGVLGVLAVLAFVAPVLPHLRAGDPWSAAWVAGGVLTLGHWPLRMPAIGVVWLAITVEVLSR